MLGGYAGTILRVDLTSGTITKEATANADIENFIGGRGLNVKTLYDEVAPGIDAFSPENKLILGVGPLVGTLAPSSGRMTITTKSPLSTYGETNIGGYFGVQLKHAGYDQVIISGRSEKPVYIDIVNETVQLKDAGHIWGKSTLEAQNEIAKASKDPDTQVISIGPAGENLVRFACIKGSGKNTAGRTGTGAVMGSKNLKAIAVRGTRPIKLAKPKEFLEFSVKTHESIKDQCRAMSGVGLDEVPKQWFEELDLCVFGNFETTTLDGFKPGLFEAFNKAYVTKHVGCANCAVGCQGKVSIPGLPDTILSCFPLGDFSVRVKNADLRGMAENIIMANRCGVDTTSAGAVIALIFDLYNKGFLTKEDAEDIPLDRPDKDTVNTLIRKISLREGKIGNLFAEGSLRAARALGKGAEYHVVHTRGLEPSPSDLRVLKGKALSNAVMNRGESIRAPTSVEMSSIALMGQDPEELLHGSFEMTKTLVKEITGTEKAAYHFEYEGKPALVAHFEIETAVYDNIGMCKYHGQGALALLKYDSVGEILSLATGMKIGTEELRKAAEKTVVLERAFLAREGIRRDDDSVGEKLFKEPIPDGMHKGAILDRDKFERMKDEFYALRGYDVTTGIPARKKLEELGLDTVADDLEKIQADTTME
jgi:aldehyde:ferredoxin oxidoreductase